MPDPPAPTDIMEDFYIIAQENNQANKDGQLDNTSSETQVKSLTKFLRNITGGNVSSSFNSTNLVANSTSTQCSASQTVNQIEPNIRFDLA